jgi:O-antigen biosynthesis protein
MKISVIIVNYNVKHFLEQCLHSVIRASKNMKVEIFVVDNNSVDGSIQLIREKFPEINLIENKKNVGFSKANNQAIKKAKGKYILLLNPDTVVEEDTFIKVTDFMDKHPEAGGLGVKMIDGKGNFLPESKRGLPTPWVAFSKMFGLSKLFPKSRKFDRYHLSYLDENKIHAVDVLAGAFMLIRSEVFNKTGLLDETFFMYGEDIDMSYRITQHGYVNYYFPETTIIHYKGESTKKGSLNYVKFFYKAMIIFAQKHFSGGKVNAFTFFINLAVWFHALLSILKRITNYIFLPLIDAVIIYSGYLFLVPLWENIRFKPGYYAPEFLNFVVPVYILFWLTAVFFSGGYKKPVSLLKVGRGILYGTISILLIYSLMDEKYRFSRALILMGSVWTALSLILYRLFLHWINCKAFSPVLKKTKKIAIAGNPDEANRVKNLLERTQIDLEFAGFIATDDTVSQEQYIGSLSQLEQIVRINRIDEIIFCAGNISSTDIIKAMLELTGLDIDYKIAPPESYSIIGSNSVHTAGDLYVVHINAISAKSNRRKKRAFDFVSSLAILFISPLVIWFFKRKADLLKNILDVLTGKKSWVGYSTCREQFKDLPPLKQGILTPVDKFGEKNFDPGEISELNILYAKNYSISGDAEIIIRNFKKLSRKKTTNSNG